MRYLLLLLLCILPLRMQCYMGAVMDQATECDDAQARLEVDWNTKDFSPFTCPSTFTFAVSDVDEIHYVIPNLDPRKDEVGHKCMNESISYNETIPLWGDHRPNWPQYGEYLYVPVQRWLHNLEHGSIILLYHPCVDPSQLSHLRSLVQSCLYRHIITPYNKLSEQRPLCLLSWGARLEMSSVRDSSVVSFIRQHARNAPEDISRNGKYSLHLIQPSKIVSTIDDDSLCPSFPNSTTKFS